jgi:hypothetical protein
LTGLYHPLVEQKQVKLDGLVQYRATRGDVFNGELWLWRLQGTTGIFSFLQATAYGGTMFVKNFMSGGAFDKYTSVGGRLTLRAKRAEVYAAANLHPAALTATYPAFILGRGDAFTSYHDFLNADPGGDANLHLGLRFLFCAR